jgi:hypothetical protein
VGQCRGMFICKNEACRGTGSCACTDDSKKAPCAGGMCAWRSMKDVGFEADLERTIYTNSLLRNICQVSGDPGEERRPIEQELREIQSAVFAMNAR